MLGSTWPHEAMSYVLETFLACRILLNDMSNTQTKSRENQQIQEERRADVLTWEKRRRMSHTRTSASRMRSASDLNSFQEIFQMVSTSVFYCCILFFTLLLLVVCKLVTSFIIEIFSKLSWLNFSHALDIFRAPSGVIFRVTQNPWPHSFYRTVHFLDWKHCVHFSICLVHP